MRNKIFTVIAFLAVLYSAPVFAGTFSYLPMAPKENSEIALEYTPNKQDAKWCENAKNLHAVVFTFTYENDVPEAHEVPLSKSGDKYQGTYLIPNKTVYIMFKVGDGQRYDTNVESYWSTIVYGENGRPLLGAHMKDAFSYFGALPAQCKRAQDLNEAVSILSNELMAHPNNIVARVNQVFLSAQLGQLDEQESKAKLREIVANNLKASTALDAIALSQAYEKLDQHEEGVRVMNDATRRFPKGRAEEQLDIQQLQGVPNIKNFADNVLIHLKKYPNSFAKQNLLDIIVKASTQQGELGVLADFLDKATAVPALTYYMAVNYLGANDSLRPFTYKYIEKGLESAKDVKTKPTYMGISEWRTEQRIATSQLLFVKGALYKADKKLDKAEQTLLSSIEVGGDEVEKAPYELLVNLYKEQDQTAKAIEKCSTAIVRGVASQVVMDTYRILQREKGIDSAKVELGLAELRKAGRSKHLDKLAREMLNLSLIDGELQNLDSSKMRLSDYKGSVVILDYWATWCGPCKMSFPSLQKLYERYKDNPKVKFAIVNVWEKGDDRFQIVRDFLSKNKNLKFPMLLDENDELVAKYGVTGIPTKFYLGMDGKIQFKEVGLLPDEQFLDEATNRIELLLRQE
ncbi:MAG: TlpA family protein disulfide reductase [Ignavibacteria bacterium]|nr:TlpA family protein disulfide reductase [Ignavibacteria bacterium]